jgi:phosphodiesterase/alkaline phosphatase D-like protein
VKRRSIIAMLGLGALLAGLVGVAPAALAATPTAPSAPTGLSATPGNTTVALTWTAPTDNGGSVITGYNVYEGTSVGGENYSTAVNGSTLIATTTYSVTGLTNATKYYFTVKAVNAIGSSAPSNEAWATPAATVPGPPLARTSRQQSPGSRPRAPVARTSPSTRSQRPTRPFPQGAARAASGPRDRSHVP